jgi:transcriptional regulator with XRE-family HTH domain
MNDPKAQGAALRAWRKLTGLSLERAAELIAIEAEKAGIGPKSRSVPRSHASLIRWETGQNKDYKLIGLDLIARVYGVATHDIMRMPPPNAAPTPTPPDPPLDQQDEAKVSEFREFLRTRKGQ